MRDRVFISYSSKDKEWLDKILLKLKPLVDEGLVVWTDQHILPGKEWPPEIETALCRTKVAVLLVSDHFFSSEYIQTKELPRFLGAAKQKQLTILPVLLDHCCWEGTEIANYQSPCNSKTPLIDFVDEGSQSKQIKQIALEIKATWEKPIWSQSLPGEEEAQAAMAEFLQLADQNAALPAVQVDACFRRAVNESHPEASRLQEVFPQLSSVQTLGWPQLKGFFGESQMLTRALVKALQRQLRAPAGLLQPSSQSGSYIALVVEKRDKDRATRYYTWSVFEADGVTNTYQKRNILEGLDLYSNQVVFDQPQENEIDIATILAKLINWANRNTTRTVLEIFVPTELLDAPWSELVVEQRGKLSITLLQSTPFALRPVDRLYESFYSKRPRLQDKLQMLAAGQAQWCAGNLAADPLHLFVSLVEEDRGAGIKRLKPFPADATKRHSWLDGLVASMVPIAIWYRHGSKVSPAKGIAHLDCYEMLGGHNHGDPISQRCVRYDGLVRQRKILFNEPAAKHLVLMLDHWQRIPPITPQARGASRAISP